MEHLTFEMLRWLVLIAITLHNLAEARWLPDWSQHAGRFQHPVSRWEFGVAVTGVTLLSYQIGAWSMAAGPYSIGTLLLCAYAAVMLLNAFVPHLAATLLLDRYRPCYHFYGHTGKPLDLRVDTNGVTTSCKLTDLHWDTRAPDKLLEPGGMGILRWHNRADQRFEVVDAAWWREYTMDG